jgi:TetR/AcrR family transcriptional regulator
MDGHSKAIRNGDSDIFGGPDREEPRERILAAAARLFARHGCGRVSVREITREAGVNMAMVSYYFGGKDGLYREILDRIFGVLAKTVERGRGLSPLERVALYVRSVDELHTKYRNVAPILYHEILHPSPAFREKFSATISGIVSFLEDSFAEGQREGVFRKDADPALMSYVVASVVNYRHILRAVVELVLPDLAKEGKNVDPLLTLLLEGMKTR